MSRVSRQCPYIVDGHERQTLISRSVHTNHQRMRRKSSKLHLTVTRRMHTVLSLSLTDSHDVQKHVTVHTTTDTPSRHSAHYNRHPITSQCTLQQTPRHVTAHTTTGTQSRHSAHYNRHPITSQCTLQQTPHHVTVHTTSGTPSRHSAHYNRHPITSQYTLQHVPPSRHITE